MTARVLFGWFSIWVLGALLIGCSPNSKEDGDSQTNWLEACHDDSQCATGNKCLCGVCTKACVITANTCSKVQQGSCLASSEAGVIAQCGGSPPPAPGLCMIPCKDSSGCSRAQACVAGVCSPLPDAPVDVTVDLDTRHQELVGFGASVAYGEAQITGHPQQATLYQTIFTDLGLDVLRFRNRFQHAGDDDLSTAGELVAAGSAALGRPLGVFLSTWSPPTTLKANGALVCSGNVQTCTLTKNASGAFDYAGLGEYWAGSLSAYAKVGLVPDYMGIQNNPNYIPSSAESNEACKFLPTEGTVSVPVGLTTVKVTYPGLAQAQSALLDALSTLPTRPKLLAPETSGVDSIADYVPSLDISKTDALAHQLYGVNPAAVDLDALANIGKLATQYSRPVFVTEMQADGFGTAVLIHYATVVEGASAYLQAGLTGPVSGPLTNTQALLGIDSATYRIQDPYHAMRHFAAHTDPAWTRVGATAASGSGLLVSAWQSPTGQDLTLVLINGKSIEVSARLDLPGDWSTSEVTRSVFSGVERWSTLGALSSQRVLRLPPESVVTVALSR
jgi:glucuronoarabinoxylan endo-1,4-beta-xylanase